MAEAAWEQPEGRGAQTVGQRVRSLRRSAGLSQVELAGGRFSKEYVSQIERGKTRPSGDTLEWLADRLETDREFLEHGLTRADAERVEAGLREAELLNDAARYGEALEAFGRTRELNAATLPTAFSLRLLRGEAWTRIRTGDLDAAMALLEDAAALTVAGGFTDADRGDVVFQVGVVRYSQSRVAEAIVLFDEALILAEVDPPADRLRSDIFHWRARCHRRTRDWVAAQEDIERALELAEACDDERRVADALFQASLVAQRQGRWVLSRAYAERSRELFDALGDRATVARLLNNLAGLNHLLGDSKRAIALLEEAFAIFVDLDLAVDAGTPAPRGPVSSWIEASSSPPRRTRARRSSCSTVASTTCRRAAWPSSSSGGRSRDAVRSTRLRSGSRLRTGPSPRRSRWGIAALPGWHRETSRASRAAMLRPRRSTDARHWRCATRSSAAQHDGSLATLVARDRVETRASVV